MSVVQRVIKLNKPFKLRGYTILQWIILVGSFAIATVLGSQLPQSWKIGNLPLGFLVWLLLFSGGIVFVHASKMKPGLWWKNQIFYRLNITPRLYFPHREEGNIYPDPSIIEADSHEDDSYVTSDQ